MEPIQITEEYLFAKIGRLVVEVELLAQQFAEKAKDEQSDENRPNARKEPHPGQGGDANDRETPRNC
jgi:hypothetical protein